MNNKNLISQPGEAHNLSCKGSQAADVAADATRLYLKDIGHTMPSEDQFLAAARWIDRPVQQARTQAADAAAKLFTQIDQDSLADPSAELSRRERRLLERVTIIAPWTEPAWTAAYRLTGSTPEQE